MVGWSFSWFFVVVVDKVIWIFGYLCCLRRFFFIGKKLFCDFIENKVMVWRRRIFF